MFNGAACHMACVLKLAIATWLVAIFWTIVWLPALVAPDHKKLLDFVEAALEATTKAGWSSEFKPKMHWPLHFAESVKRWGKLTSCWAMERKHKSIRKYGTNRCTTSSWESALLKDVIAEHLHNLETDSNLFRRDFSWTI